MEHKNPNPGGGRLFGALEFLAEDRLSGTYGGRAPALDQNKTTAHRVLNSLIYMGYARQNAVNGRYESTFKVVDVANRIMGMVDIVQIVRPYLRKLMEATGRDRAFCGAGRDRRGVYRQSRIP